MIEADRILASEELEMMASAIAEMGLDLTIEIKDRSVEELCAEVSAPQTQALMLLELASLAYVDNEYAAEERALLHSIARIWNTDPMTLIRIEAWAEQRIQLSREAAEVVREVEAGWRRS